MSKLKVNVVIDGLPYPLSVNNIQEEKGLRNAAKKINTLITEYENKFDIASKQEVLAMCALKFASKLELSQLKKDESNSIAVNTINEMTDLIDKHL